MKRFNHPYQLNSVTMLIFILLLSACRSITNIGGPNLSDVPGAYAYSEGETDFAYLYREAAKKMEKNKFEEAQKIYQQLIQLEPNNFNGYVGLGSSLYFQDRFEKAREAYQKAYELNANSSQAIIGIGSTYSATGEYQEAIKAYRLAAEMNPDDINAYWGMAIAMENNGASKDEIVIQLEKIIEIDPESALAEQATDWIEKIYAEN